MMASRLIALAAAMSPDKEKYRAAKAIKKAEAAGIVYKITEVNGVRPALGDWSAYQSPPKWCRISVEALPFNV